MTDSKTENISREYTDAEMDKLKKILANNKNRNYTITEDDLNKTIEYVLFYKFDKITKQNIVVSCLSSMGILYDVDGKVIDLTDKLGLMTFLNGQTVGRLIALNFLEQPDYFMEYYYCASHRNIVKTNEWYNLCWKLDGTKLQQNNLLQFKNNPKELYEFVMANYCNKCFKLNCNCKKNERLIKK
jgi:hypothetical protein